MLITVMAEQLLLSTFLSGLVGLERERRSKAAGFKTQVLVGLGTTVLTHVSLHGFPLGDPSRVAAQVVTGVGFIGAGAILQRGTFVRGVTTAATLWVTMSIGMAVGVGWYALAGLVTAIVLVVLYCFETLEAFLLPRRRPRAIRMRLSHRPEQKEAVAVLLRSQRGQVRRGEWLRTSDGQRIRLSVSFLDANEEAMSALAEQLVASGVGEVEWSAAGEEEEVR